MKVHVQPERTIRPLYCRDGAGVCVRNGAEPESGLGSATERAPELPHERAHDLRAEPPIVTELRALVLSLEGVTRIVLEEGDEGRHVTDASIDRARRVMSRLASATLAGEGPGVAPLPTLR